MKKSAKERAPVIVTLLGLALPPHWFMADAFAQQPPLIGSAVFPPGDATAGNNARLRT